MLSELPYERLVKSRIILKLMQFGKNWANGTAQTSELEIPERCIWGYDPGTGRAWRDTSGLVVASNRRLGTEEPNLKTAVKRSAHDLICV